MPRVSLTDRFCANVKSDAARVDYFDEKTPGLVLRVAPTSVKTFTLFYGPAAERKRLTLGRYPALSLSRARTLAIEAQGNIKEGISPRRADQTTIGEIAEKYIAEHLASKRRGKVDAREIRKYIVSHWRHKPITEITPEDVKTLIKPIARRTPAQAHMILSHVRRIWSWAINFDTPYGIVQSPAHLLSPRALIGERNVRKRVLDDKEIRAYWRAADAMGYPSGSMYQLIMLTGTRIAEAAEARWSEIDLKQKLWTIPSERFKSEQEHVVPLSTMAVSLLRKLPRGKTGSHVFSTTGGVKAINGFSNSKKALDEIMLADLGELKPFVTHDARRTVRTRLAELAVDDKIAEMVIGHGKKGIARVYDHARHLPEMRAALDKWAKRLAAIVKGAR